jgi:hypothetical protein
MKNIDTEKLFKVAEEIVSLTLKDTKPHAVERQSIVQEFFNQRGVKYQLVVQVTPLSKWAKNPVTETLKVKELIKTSEDLLDVVERENHKVTPLKRQIQSFANRHHHKFTLAVKVE